MRAALHYTHSFKVKHIVFVEFFECRFRSTKCAKKKSSQQICFSCNSSPLCSHTAVQFVDSECVCCFFFWKQLDRELVWISTLSMIFITHRFLCVDFRAISWLSIHFVCPKYVNMPYKWCANMHIYKTPIENVEKIVRGKCSWREPFHLIVGCRCSK